MPLPNLDITATGPAAAPKRGHVLRIAGPSHPLRPDLERFIETRFAIDFAASLPGHYPLIAFIESDGRPIAAAGVRFAELGPLFLERYLDEPLEQQLAGAFGRPTARDAIVEIGSLTTISPAAALDLFEALSSWLRRAAGQRFAVATLGPDLARMLQRLGFCMKRLAAADPRRLGEGAAAWGRYYDRAPAVFGGRIPDLDPGPQFAATQAKIRRRAASLRRPVAR